MNQNESEFEQQLRALRPQPASAALEEKIAAALERQKIVTLERAPTAAILRGARAVRTPVAGWLRGLGWAFAGAVTAVAVIAMLDRGEARKQLASAAVASSAEAFEHTEASDELVTAEDEGLVMADDQEPVRQVHYYSVERHVWTNPHTGARMEFEIPREDVRFTPVALQ